MGCLQANFVPVITHVVGAINSCFLAASLFFCPLEVNDDKKNAACHVTEYLESLYASDLMTLF